MPMLLTGQQLSKKNNSWKVRVLNALPRVFPPREFAYLTVYLILLIIVLIPLALAAMECVATSDVIQFKCELLQHQIGVLKERLDSLESLNSELRDKIDLLKQSAIPVNDIVIEDNRGFIERLKSYIIDWFERNLPGPLDPEDRDPFDVYIETLEDERDLQKANESLLVNFIVFVIESELLKALDWTKGQLQVENPDAYLWCRDPLHKEYYTQFNDPSIKTAKKDALKLLRKTELWDEIIDVVKEWLNK